jgi:hypothetical protein
MQRQVVSPWGRLAYCISTLWKAATWMQEKSSESEYSYEFHSVCLSGVQWHWIVSWWWGHAQKLLNMGNFLSFVDRSGSWESVPSLLWSCGCVVAKLPVWHLQFYCKCSYLLEEWFERSHQTDLSMEQTEELFSQLQCIYAQVNSLCTTG